MDCRNFFNKTVSNMADYECKMSIDGFWGSKIAEWSVG